MIRGEHYFFCAPAGDNLLSNFMLIEPLKGFRNKILKFRSRVDILITLDAFAWNISKVFSNKRSDCSVDLTQYLSGIKNIVIFQPLIFSNPSCFELACKHKQNPR